MLKPRAHLRAHLFPTCAIICGANTAFALERMLAAATPCRHATLRLIARLDAQTRALSVSPARVQTRVRCAACSSPARAPAS
eukprot:3153524-Alexandrium_andersonii.AAC.1